ncbi:SdiA-regulated domain-containing protein [Hufsiella ginkgonis]|uniref:SdiA-regulated family protein n=1 Tax=Hufsiella ginkgonis TaxID=2695274 RepID=A0A7K1Y0M9_9SPHI|nr:SdiA-regulated domain-containing protein [Hufsiella ginkgonis]MXV16793.1 hypothetical protein [Hufsiella ginkgonis]
MRKFIFIATLAFAGVAAAAFKFKARIPAGITVAVTAKYELPSALREISALAYLDATHFACVQDESGHIYIYNTASAEVESKIRFYGPGDFEGLAVNGTTAWVLRSDGLIFQVKNYRSAAPVITQYKTPLTAGNNTEGLCFDRKNNRLLIAVKDSDPNGKNVKGIYAFSLQTMKMAPEPVYRINQDDELFTSGKKKKKTGVHPSAIAINPVNDQLYVVDGPDPKILSLNRQGRITSLVPLNRKEFKQPEGITFSPSGELFISNEGGNGAGNILKVKLGG